MDHQDHNMTMNMDDNNKGGMQMTFYSGKHLVLLFSGWVTKKPAEYALTLLAVACFAVLHQLLGCLYKRYSSYYSSGKGGDFTKKIICILVYALYTSTGYLLMLSVMSFNVGIFIAVVVGLCVGFVIFPKKHSDQQECSAQP